MEKHITALHKAITAVPEEERDYAVRFVRANAHKSPEELLDWEQDRADRDEAAKIEAHRKERVLAEFAETFGKDAVVGITGVTADGKASKGKGN